MMGALLDLGALPSSVDDCGSTAPHIAAFEGHADLVRLLIAPGANASVEDAWGQTPMHNAAQTRHGLTSLENSIAIVDSLIASGADINARDENMASPLHLSVEHSSQEMVEALISKAAEVDAQDRRGRTPLHVAAEYLKCDIYDVLVREGANESILDDEGDSAPLVRTRSRWWSRDPFFCWKRSFQG